MTARVERVVGHVTAKLKRSLKALAVVVLIGTVGVLVARPLARFGESQGPIDPAPPAYLDLEAEGRAPPPVEMSDSEIEDEARRPQERILQVGSGETLNDLMTRAGVAAAEAARAAEALYTRFDPRTLKAGQKATVVFDPSPFGFGHGPFRQISLAADPLRDVTARRGADGGFSAHEEKRQATRQIAHYTGTIKSSLFESATSAGVPVPVILAMIKALSYDVDFQRDIQPGDTFEVLFEALYDTKGRLVRSGDLLFAGLDLSGSEVTLYRYPDGAGGGDFFTARGESVKKSLLKTPVDGAKITSGFGMRHHPILGYSKMHKGIDFGVPPGTPIQAAGDGAVEVAGPYGAYGNYVRLRHSNGFGTAYAHMSRIAPGIHTGRRVNQGQIIGFVGATGRATGPHLHYEVLVGSEQVNPMSIKVPTGIKLAGRDLDRFQAHRRRVDLMMARIPSATHAALDTVKGGAND
jgi:murein DD-endopeptidase MepM/ murein hydrolase activator NlpD